jgi:hydroxyacylglutathione hydrolase
MNRRGAGSIAALGPPHPLSAEEARAALDAGAVALDVRENVAHGSGHVPGSVNVGLGGQFASWVGTLLDPNRDLVLVASSEDEARQSVVRLARVGFERVVGWLQDGMASWVRAGYSLDTTPQVTVEQLREMLAAEPDLQVVDVRRPGEYASARVPGAVGAPLDWLDSSLDGVDVSRPTAVICAGGYRSSIATSLMRARGFDRLYNVLGGTGAWVRAGYETDSGAS